MIDNFLEQDELARLNNKKLWEDLAKVETTMYTPREHLFSTARISPWERLANIVHERVFRPKSAKALYGDRVRLEYWCNIINTGEDLGWHQDKDEALYESTGRIVCPVAGAVYYGFPHTVAGGMLSIRHDIIDTELLRPKYNRLVAFDVSKQHKVAAVVAGTRFGFQVNLW